MANKLFDKSHVFNQRIAPLLNRINQLCMENEVPIFTSITLGATQKDENTDFSVLASVGGAMENMPIEQMIGAALANPVFMNSLQVSHARFLLAMVSMPPEHAQTAAYRADFRAATAYVAARDLVKRAQTTLHNEADAVRSMSGFFQALMSEAVARTEHPELFAGDALDTGSLPAEYTDFINSLFKGKSNG